MAFICDVSITVIALLTIGAIAYVKWIYSYWKRKQYIGDLYESNYKIIKSTGHKHGGLFIFTSPAYMPVDLDLIKCVMTKNFQNFNERGMYCNEKYDPLSAHLLNVTGEKWKNLRGKLTTAFTPVKIKMMFDMVLACSFPLIDNLEEYTQTQKPFDADNIMTCFTTDVIGSCAFGLECNSFKDPNSQFRKFGQQILRVPTRKLVALSFGEFNKTFANFLRITRTTSAARKFFITMVEDTVKFRRQNGIVRKDFMQILMDLQDDSTEDDPFTIPQMTAQCILFFIGGFDTSATTLTFTLLELAKNAEIQNRLRNEINNVLKQFGNHITYDAINEMFFLSQVVDETLRKYPPAGVVARKCTETFQVPHTDLVIEKGLKVTISIQGIHHDPEYYPNPDEYDPDRFNSENKKYIKPYAYLPFGEGPRGRFGLMQIKIGLVSILQKFKVSLNSKTPKTLRRNFRAISLTLADTLWLDVEKVQ